MNNINDLSSEKVKKLSYTDFISLIEEENRPSGGKKTIREIIKNTFLDEDSKVLEVGCTNGFTTLEIARTVGCEVVGIDINEKSIRNARLRLEKDSEQVKNNVSFRVGDATDMPFSDNEFDLVVCGNATSFIENKKQAFSEYKRVLKDWGFIATVPIYYIDHVPDKILDKLSNTLNVDIEKRSKEDWKNFFTDDYIEIYYEADYEFKYLSDEEIEEYVTKSLQKPKIKKLSEDVKESIHERWKETIKLFNENLSYTNFSIMILRKRLEKEEPEAFDGITRVDN